MTEFAANDVGCDGTTGDVAPLTRESLDSGRPDECTNGPFDKVSWWNILGGVSQRVRSQKTMSAHGITHLRVWCSQKRKSEGPEKGEWGGLT